MKHVLLIFAFCFALHADTIFAPGLLPDGAGNFSGAWIGTFTDIPAFGEQTMEIAQEFTAGENYNTLTLTLDAFMHGTVDLEIVAYSNGLPLGPVMGSASFAVDTPALQEFTVGFGDAVLTPGTYWVVASSPDSARAGLDYSPELPVPILAFGPMCGDAGDVPCTPQYALPWAVSSNGAWTVRDDGNTFAMEMDGIDPPAVEAVPESSYGYLVVIAGVLVWRLKRRINQ